MLAENSNYCLKNETEYQDPEEFAETQKGLSITQSASSVQGRCARHGRGVNNQGHFF